MVEILIRQIVVMLIMMMVGVALVRAKMVDEAGVKQLSKVAMYAATPAVIIRAFDIDYSSLQLRNGLWVMLFFTIALLLSALIAHFACGKDDTVGQYAVVFSNSSYIGIPLISAVLGEEYVFYVTMTIAVVTFAMWTYGVWLISGDRSQMSLKKVFTNPAIIALLVGMLLFLTSPTLPDLIDSAIDGIADLNTGLAMIILGANLGNSSIPKLLKETRLYKACALRLIVVPLVVLLTLFFMPVTTEIKAMLLIVEAAPAGVATSMLAQMFDADYRYATGLVVMSTLLSMVTMPLMLGIALPLL